MARAQHELFQNMFNSLQDMKQPVIAVVDGYALAGGFEMILNCDMIVAADTATFGLPEEFVSEITRNGFLAALIPEEYGGSGLGITEASIILEEINRSGGNAGACHAQMYTMGTLLRHGNEEQKAKYLPKIADGSLRLQAFGVTEPNTGTDTTSLKTFAERKGDKYIVNGQKVFISRTEYSDLMILLVRTTPLDQVNRRTFCFTGGS